jgi:hypothetical protein
MTGCVEQDREGVPDLESIRYLPRQDLSGKVVDHRMEIRSSAVEKTDDRRVDVPVGVRS